MSEEADRSPIEELKAELRATVHHIEAETRRKIARLRDLYAEANSQERRDGLTRQMEEAHRENIHAAAAPRAHLDQILKVQAAIESLKPVTLIVPSSEITQNILDRTRGRIA